MEPFSQAIIYLVKTLFSLYTFVILLRFLLQVARADFYNPLSQAVVKITDPAIKPLRRIIPGFFGLDFSALILALLVQLVAIVSIYLLYSQTPPNILLILGWSALGLFSMVLNIYFFAMIIVIVLSWIAPYSNNPGAVLVFQLTEPVMRPARNLIPAIGGLDLSPIFIFIAINLIEIMVISPLASMLYLPRGLIMGL